MNKEFEHSQSPIPTELCSQRRWVNWNREQRGDKWTKPPYVTATGQKADVTNPADWTDVQTALRACKWNGGSYAGVGFVVTADDPYTVIDLDHCRNPESGMIEPWAMNIIRALHSRSEISPSYTGVKVWVRCRIPGHRRRKGDIEMYCDKRYLTVTGDVLTCVPETIEERQQALDRLYRETFGDDTRDSPDGTDQATARALDPVGTQPPPPCSQGDLGTVTTACATDERLRQLWAGDYSKYPSQSEADLSLCGILARLFGNDATRVDALFRQSRLMREKWLRDDYRTMTLTKACTPAMSQPQFMTTPGMGIPALSRSVEDVLAEMKTLTKPLVVSDIERLLREMSRGLQGADSLHRAAAREGTIAALKELGLQAPTKMVDAALEPPSGTPDKCTPPLAPPVPWPQPVDGLDLINEIYTTICRHLIIPWQAAVAMALWVLHAHAHDAFDISPILVLRSPMHRCGKTTALDILIVFVPKALSADNITVAVLFRIIEREKPTLLIDEADTFLGDDDELRGILNAGHRKGKVAFRCEGDDHEPRAYHTWAPKAIALIGAPHATLVDRSIVITMQRKKKQEKVERWRTRNGPLLSHLCRKACRWATDNLHLLSESNPVTPEQLHDRAADNWEPLLAIADAIGGDWPSHARNAALFLSGIAGDENQSLGEDLIADIQQMFASRGDDKILTRDLVHCLNNLSHHSWKECRNGRELNAQFLSRLLAPFNIRPRTIRNGTETAKGYIVTDFHEAFTRYCQAEPVTPVTSPNPDGLGSSDPSQITPKGNPP